MIIGILQKPQRLRNEKDLRMLVPLIKTIKFFIERDIKDEECLLDIVSCMTYEQISLHDNVFDFGK